MNEHHSFARLSDWLRDHELDITGVVASADWAQYLPESLGRLPHQSIVLFGAGGPGLLRRCEAYMAEHGELEHWLSDYAEQLFIAACGARSQRYLHPYRSGLSFPFQRAAVASGIGIMGLNHVVLSPTWGPWYSLLGALVLDEAVPPTAPAGFDPCTGCHAPCLAACPSGAVSRTGYDGRTCLETKLSHKPCLHACPARHACVVRTDLRQAMVRLESSRPHDDEKTRTLLRSFL